MAMQFFHPRRLLLACKTSEKFLVFVLALHSIVIVALSSCAVAATPRMLSDKLDRIFILTAVGLDGNILVTKSPDGATKSIYATISSSGYLPIKGLINKDYANGKAPVFKLITESLGHFLDTWENLRRLDKSISAVIVPDSDEVKSAYNLLLTQGISRNEAEKLIGADAVVFCPVPAVYAEEYRDTYHHRNSGYRFIPCSFSEATLRKVLMEPLDRKQTTILPLPLWSFIRQLSTEKDESINSIEVIAHPSVGEGIDSAIKNKNFTRDTLMLDKPSKSSR